MFFEKKKEKEKPKERDPPHSKQGDTDTGNFTHLRVTKPDNEPVTPQHSERKRNHKKLGNYTFSKHPQICHAVANLQIQPYAYGSKSDEGIVDEGIVELLTLWNRTPASEYTTTTVASYKCQKAFAPAGSYKLPVTKNNLTFQREHIRSSTNTIEGEWLGTG